MSNNIHRKLFLFVYIGLALDPTLGARKDFRSGDSIQSLDLTTPVPARSLAVESACKSRVEIYGYPCEEHTVLPVTFFRYPFLHTHIFTIHHITRL